MLLQKAKYLTGCRS